MEQYRLKFDSRISELEKENRWKTAVEMVFRQWKDLPDDLDRLLCAGTELWYAILMMENCRNDPCPPDNMEFIPNSQLQKDLMDVTRYGFLYFSENSNFNAFFGYMIKVMPYFFPDYDGDYFGWQEKGIDMMRQAYILEPDNPIAEAMYHEPESAGPNTPYYDACKKIWSQISPEQWGDSAVQQYFFRILQGDLFYADAYEME